MVEIGRQRPARQPDTHPATRTCVGCRQRDDRSALLRVVAQVQDDGRTTAVVDVRQRLNGRGAWLHPREGCLALALQRRAFGRALRVTSELDATAVGAWLAGHPGHPVGDDG